MRPRHLGDGAVAAAAGATAVGAWWAQPVGGGTFGVVVVASAVVVVALAWRRPMVLCAGLALLASTLGARSWEGLRRVPTSGAVSGVATLVTDPVEVRGGLRAEVRLHGRRYEAWAYGRHAGVLRTGDAGDRVRLSGRRQPLSGLRRPYLLRRHVGARLRVDDVRPHDGGSTHARAANGLRDLLRRGVASFPEGKQAMFAGIVLGDDRGQPEAIVEDFRESGLSHLLAVSGQNVAFVLALASPLLLLLGLRARVVTAMLVLAFFGVMTRWEPSVLRAEGMAAVALLTKTAGRPVSSIRGLSLALILLLLVDPLLVGSIGFLLSVGACLGIVLFTPWLTARRVPLALGVTLAAQVGVAPVLLPVFGGLPVVSTPANLLAVPAAGPLMMWGMGAGLAAGVLGGRLAEVVHLPTQAMLAWVEGVAHHAAALGLGSFEAAHLVVLVLGVAVALTARRRPGRRLAAAVCAGVACVLAAVPPCRFGPCASASATGPTTSRPVPSSWASSTGPATPSTTRAPTSTSTGSWRGPSSSWLRAPTSSTSVG